MSDFLTFAVLYQDCCRLIGDLNKSRVNEVKSVINSVYLDEMLNVDELRPMFWLRQFDDSILMKLSDTAVSISNANPAVMVTAAQQTQIVSNCFRIIMAPFNPIGHRRQSQFACRCIR